MIAIKYIIFDLDDTLCDYQKAKENAKYLISKYLQKYEIEPNLFWHHYSLIEPLLFRQFTSSNITKDEYRVRRFSDVLKIFNEDSQELSPKLNHIYMQEANHNIELFDDVMPFFYILKLKEIKAVILTNGPSDGQRNKFESLKLSQYIEEIYISEEIGFSKPNQQAFKLVLQNINSRSSQTLMIGDSIEDDILGAEQVGMKAILIDRQSKYDKDKYVKVNNLLEIREMI